MNNPKEKIIGYKSKCINYDSCPICFKCRNFGISISKCYSRCGGSNKKNNVCISELHYPKNFEKIIKRPVIDLDK